ncbi:MAG: murein biosynthesis integral membrane protein MurJ [Nitrospirae bacterium]|nr:murein biosynthesis integral membrane protein MurJ [Nitrospirota bacterium]
MLRSTLSVSVATLISRLLGLVRDAVIAAFFPVGATDAFFVAFRLPNMFRAVLAEGATQAATIPVLKELQLQSRETVGRFLGALVTLAVPCVAGFTLLGVAFAPQLVDALAFGFRADPEKHALAVHLTRYLFPFILLITFVSLVMGVLNTYNRFFVSAVTPAVLNVGMILGALLLSRYTALPVDGLAWGVLIGGVAQLVMVLTEARAIRVPFQAAWQPGHPGVRRVGTLMASAVIGSTVYQLQVLVNTQLGSTLGTGAVSALYYADRLVQFPLALIAISMATASLPMLAELAARKDHAGLGELLDRSLLASLFLMIPAAVGLIVLREEIVQLVYQRRQFGPDMAAGTAGALGVYALGLWAFASTRISSQVFYAVQKPRIPVAAAAASLLVTAAVGWSAKSRWGVQGVAFGTVAGSVVNLAILSLARRRLVGAPRSRAVFWSELVKVAIASIAMVTVLVGAEPRLEPVLGLAPRVLALIFLGAATFGLVVWFAGSRTARSFAERIRRA